MSDLVIKDTVRAGANGDPLEYVMSDASVDRYGDVIDQAGWNLTNFKRSPIALFGHQSSQPIGIWENVRVEGGKLLGKLKLAERGTSDFIDSLHKLVEQGILRAVSVGFRPQKAEPLDPKDPYGPQRFLKSELVECSLVSIPANPNALALARSLNLSPEAKSRIFGEPAGDVLRRDNPGVSADPLKTSIPKGRQMSLAHTIQNTEATILGLQDQLRSYHEGVTELTDQDRRTIKDLTDKISASQEDLKIHKATEAALGGSSEPVVAGVHVAISDKIRGGLPVGIQQQSRETPVFAMAAAPKAKGFDVLVRGLVCKVQAKVEQSSVESVLARRYGEDHQTREVLNYMQRSASTLATTTQSGWASQLVNTAVVDFLDQLMPMSIYPGLAAQGPRFTFGQNGIISIPSRSATPTIAGSFVAEGAPIPVRQGAFGSTTITPRKMAVISVFSREIAEHSTPSIEAIIREAILEDTAVAVDTVLMDATAASTTRPAGLRNGVSAKTATTGGGIAAFITDMKALLGDLITANSLRKPVWIMSPAQALSASLLQNAGGDMMFRDEIGRGTLFGYPILLSTTVTAGTVMLIDAADFFSATSDTPRFDINDTATLHMEDTTPLAIGTAGSPNVVAAPVRSLFQTDSIGIRMIMDINWAMRRTGVISYVTSVTW